MYNNFGRLGNNCYCLCNTAETAIISFVISAPSKYCVIIFSFIVLLYTIYLIYGKLISVSSVCYHPGEAGFSSEAPDFLFDISPNYFLIGLPAGSVSADRLLFKNRLIAPFTGNHTFSS